MEVLLFVSREKIDYFSVNIVITRPPPEEPVRKNDRKGVHTGSLKSWASFSFQFKMREMSERCDTPLMLQLMFSWTAPTSQVGILLLTSCHQSAPPPPPLIHQSSSSDHPYLLRLLPRERSCGPLRLLHLICCWYAPLRCRLPASAQTTAPACAPTSLLLSFTPTNTRRGFLQSQRAKTNPLKATVFHQGPTGPPGCRSRTTSCTFSRFAGELPSYNKVRILWSNHESKIDY